MKNLYSTTTLAACLALVALPALAAPAGKPTSPVRSTEMQAQGPTTPVVSVVQPSGASASLVLEDFRALRTDSHLTNAMITDIDAKLTALEAQINSLMAPLATCGATGHLSNGAGGCTDITGGGVALITDIPPPSFAIPAPAAATPVASAPPEGHNADGSVIYETVIDLNNTGR